MEPGNPRIELEIQGHRYNQYYCGLFCPTAQWIGARAGGKKRENKRADGAVRSLSMLVQVNT